MLAKRPDSKGASRAAHLRILAGLVTAGCVLGAATTAALRTASDWAAPGLAEAATAPTPTQSPMVPAGVKPAPATVAKAAPSATHAAAVPAGKGPTASVPAPAPNRTTNPVAKAPVTVPAKAAAPVKAVTPAVLASARPTVTTTVKPEAKPPVAPPATHLEEQLTYQYNALGRRDPFQSLIGGGFVGADVGGDAPPDVGGLKVVGIVWGADDKFALVEDARGNSMVLRQGDKIMNGFVQGLKRDAMVVQLTTDGVSQTVTIPLTRKGENSNANR